MRSVAVRLGWTLKESGSAGTERTRSKTWCKCSGMGKPQGRRTAKRDCRTHEAVPSREDVEAQRNSKRGVGRGGDIAAGTSTGEGSEGDTPREAVILQEDDESRGAPKRKTVELR